jgi:hypothetical protein
MSNRPVLDWENERRYGAGLDAVQILEAEHRLVRRLFDDVRNSFRDSKLHSAFFAFQALVHLLRTHEGMEQTVWYPAIRPPVRLLHRLLGEEQDADAAIKALLGKKFGSGPWMNSFLSLRTDALHHAHEEEIRLFPWARRQIPRGRLLVIASRMRRYLRQRPFPAA